MRKEIVNIVSAIIDKKSCTGCRKCVDICPMSAIKIEKEKAVVNNDCVECGVCIDECPNNSILIPG